MIKRFVGAALLLLPMPAGAVNWIELSRTSNGSIVYGDTQTFGTTGVIGRIWVKFDHRNNRSRKERESVEFWKFNCENKTIFVASSTSYNAIGTVIGSRALPESEVLYDPVVPGSIAETVMGYACSAYNYARRNE